MDINQIKLEYDESLTVFFQVVQGSIEEFQAEGTWGSDVHSLALKMFRHMLSIKALCEISAYSPPDHPPNLYIDFSSAQIITRAAIETFLTFAYVFAQPENSLSKFRCDVWKLNGLTDRQKLLATTAEAKEKQTSEKLDIDALKINIENSPHISTYTEKQKKQILSGNWSKIRKWDELATEAGIHPTYFSNTYDYLCGYSHSSYSSAMQVTQARDMPTQIFFACTCLSVGLCFMSHFIVAFSRISPTAKSFIQSNGTATKLLEKWYITNDEWKKIYPDQTDALNNDGT